MPKAAKKFTTLYGPGLRSEEQSEDMGEKQEELRIYNKNAGRMTSGKREQM